MSELGAALNRGVVWPSNGLGTVPFRLYTDPAQYRALLDQLHAALPDFPEAKSERKKPAVAADT